MYEQRRIYITHVVTAYVIIHIDDRYTFIYHNLTFILIKHANCLHMQSVLLRDNQVRLRAIPLYYNIIRNLQMMVLWIQLEVDKNITIKYII